MTAESPQLALSWPNKDRLLVARGESDYEWIDVGAHRAQRAPELERLASFSAAESTAPESMVIAGDALDALRGLQGASSTESPEPIRVVYIDPPFNTGGAFAQYADSLDHAVWLSMLRDRLVAVRPLLGPTSSVWVHLDDAEVHRARCVLDEVFGAEAFVTTIVWQKRTTRESRTAFSSTHDYIHVYAPAGPKVWKQSRNLLARSVDALKNRDNDPRGPWADAPFTAPGYRANQHYPIVNPAGRELLPPKGRSWFATEPVYRQLLADDRIWFPRGGAGLPRMKLFPHEIRGLVPFSLWTPDDCGTNDDGKRHLMALFPDLEAFATPKPEQLLERIIHIASDPGDLVLDFFAGSGTTAAVAHKMRRRWIAIERSVATVTGYLVPRLRRVVAGADPGGITERVLWPGGGSFAVHAVAPEDSASKHDIQLFERLRSDVAELSKRPIEDCFLPEIAPIREPTDEALLLPLAALGDGATNSSEDVA